MWMNSSCCTHVNELHENTMKSAWGWHSRILFRDYLWFEGRLFKDCPKLRDRQKWLLSDFSIFCYMLYSRFPNGLFDSRGVCTFHDLLLFEIIYSSLSIDIEPVKNDRDANDFVLEQHKRFLSISSVNEFRPVKYKWFQSSRKDRLYSFIDLETLQILYLIQMCFCFFFCSHL